MNVKNEQVRGALIIRFSAVVGILACLGDIYTVYLLGTWHPAYKPWLQTMSELGHAGSPVARFVSAEWVVMGLMFILFGYGFYKAFIPNFKTAKTAGWMLALYGIGEGLGSGLIPGNPGKILESPGSIFHNLLSGIGVFAAFLLPFVIIKMFVGRKSSFSLWWSWFTIASGLIFFILFAISNFYHPEGSWISFLGLWQRLFRLAYYIFFIYLAVLMLQIKKPIQDNCGKNFASEGLPEVQRSNPAMHHAEVD